MQKRYISNIDTTDALNMLPITCQSEPELIPVAESLGRVSFEAVYAKISSPFYNCAAMDGITLIAKDTFGAHENAPKRLLAGSFTYVNTGNPIKEPYDSVIMIEDVMEQDNGDVEIIAAATPYQHVRLVGEDIVAGEMLIPSKHKIRPVDIGALTAGGVTELLVYKKPIAGIITTGNELVVNPDQMDVGRIMDSNGKMFAALCIEYGATPKSYGPVEDNFEKIAATVEAASRECDLVLINAGTSAGSEDNTVHILDKLGQVFVHGVALKPGKPTILAQVNERPVIGVPGYPVSAYVVLETFVRPIISRLSQIPEPDPVTLEAVLSTRVVSTLKSTELIRVNLGYVGGRYVATPLPRGAGVTMSLVKADGILSIDRNALGAEEGETVTVKLLKPISQIKSALVSIGSHDLCMDVLGDMMNLSSAHTGSMGGIMAMKKGLCHIAPIHLLGADGEYNVPYVKKYFPNGQMALIKGVRRLQGLMYDPDKVQINDIKDIVGKLFINRQRGSGTRMLLDYHLNLLGIDPHSIPGYDREATTHMAVAASVLSGSAEVGLGSYSAASAMNLAFTPVGFEEYDFLTMVDYLDDPSVKRFIECLKSDLFSKSVLDLGGYELEAPGTIIIVGSDN